MNEIARIFSAVKVDDERLLELNKISEPCSRYVIAITPRSGSSYLCDLMKNIRRFGTPGEVLNAQFIPEIMKLFPGRTPEEYLGNVTRGLKSGNGQSGLKISWFQFEDFCAAMSDHSYLDGFKYIYLTRRDVFAQAVSLYKATASNVFHTNVKHSAEEKCKLNSLEYSFDEINKWYEHIIRQEKGWQQYFYENSIVPLCITYEDIEEDILFVVKRIAVFVAVLPENVALPDNDSVFKKIGNTRNIEWAQRFELELSSSTITE